MWVVCADTFGDPLLYCLRFCFEALGRDERIVFFLRFSWDTMDIQRQLSAVRITHTTCSLLPFSRRCCLYWRTMYNRDALKHIDHIWTIQFVLLSTYCATVEVASMVQLTTADIVILILPISFAWSHFVRVYCPCGYRIWLVLYTHTEHSGANHL